MNLGDFDLIESLALACQSSGCVPPTALPVPNPKSGRE